jgi:hypothetical protein
MVTHYLATQDSVLGAASLELVRELATEKDFQSVAE